MNKIPNDVSEAGKKAAQAILAHAEAILMHAPRSSSCQTFYSPAAWKARGEMYGLNSLLIVVYDGGDLDTFFEYETMRYDRIGSMAAALTAAGFWSEACTRWYSAVYPH